MNWVIPGKFLAFMGPIDTEKNQPKKANGPEDYL
jgi:hypothetical protein